MLTKLGPNWLDLGSTLSTCEQVWQNQVAGARKCVQKCSRERFSSTVLVYGKRCRKVDPREVIISQPTLGGGGQFCEYSQTSFGRSAILRVWPKSLALKVRLFQLIVAETYPATPPLPKNLNLTFKVWRRSNGQTLGVDYNF